MATMNISLSDDLRDFIEERVANGGYMTSSEYVRDVLRRERERENLRAMIVEGAQSELGPEANEAYFDALRERIRPKAGR